MLLSAFLIVWTLQSDSWWHKLLHFIFIISNNHFFFTSTVYNCQTACCIMKFKAVYQLEGSHVLYLYLHVFMWILFFHNRQTGMMNVGLRSLWDMWLPAELICGQATSSFTVKRASVCATFYHRGASSSSQHVVLTNKDFLLQCNVRMT